VDVILGSVRAGAPDSHVPKRHVLSEKQVNRGEVVVDFPLPPASTPYYIRLRGTNTGEGEPALDAEGEDPDADRWFYSNPVWITQDPSPGAGPAIVPR
jgi:hypothetical protein